MKKERKKTSPIWLIDRDRLISVIESSSSIKEILSYFGLKTVANYKTLKARLIKENLDLSKLKKYNRGKLPETCTPLNLVLIENSSYSRGFLKIRLLREKILDNKCDICGLGPEWQSKPLSLQLEHKNGINNDNRIENLCLLCPNCHSQTTTFSGKRKSEKINCPVCYKVIKKGKTCSLCNPKKRYSKRKVERPLLDVLLDNIEKLGYVGTGKLYGVTDNAIRKWIKSYKKENIYNASLVRPTNNTAIL